jgi:hypothetical protein
MTKRFILGLFSLLGSCSSLSFAVLQVVPTRVTLTDDARVGNLTLIHTGEKPGHYKVTAVFYRTKPDGTTEAVTDPREEERPLGKYLHFSPRQFTIQPNQERVIRVMYAGPKGLPDGEYRAHLHFQPGDEDEGIPVMASKPGKIAMRLEAKLAVAIPIIYRHGKTSLTATLSDLTLVKMPADRTTDFQVTLLSQGNAFPFGDFFVFFTPKGGEAKQIGMVRGASAYSDKRTFTYPLSLQPGEELINGVLMVEYRESADTAVETPKVLASTEAAIP